MAIRTDFHSHLARSSALEMAREADARDLEVLGISEHDYQIVELRRLVSQYELEGRELVFQSYFDEIRAAARSVACELRLGLEVDFIPAINRDMERNLASVPWDFLIGSVHEVDGEQFELPQEFTPDRGRALWLRYLELLKSAVLSGRFDVVSHPTRMFLRNPHLPADFDSRLEELAAAAAGHNVALEINGRDLLGYPEVVPRLVKACALHRTAVSAGSDAHLPIQLGRAQAATEALMRRCGIDRVRTWKQRQPEVRLL